MGSELKQQGQAVSKFGWLLLGFLWVAFLINNIDRQVVFSIFPILTGQLHFSRFQLGLVGSVFLWAYCGSNPLLGWLADVIQRERLVIGSMILWSLATLGTALSRSVPSFLACRAALGLAESLYVPAALSLIAAWHPGKTRSTALGIHSSSQFAGLAVGGWFGGRAAETIGWRWGLGVWAAIGVIHAAVVAMVLRGKSTPRPERKWASASPLAVFRSQCYVAILIAYTVFSGMLWIFYGWLSAIVYAKYHLSLAGSGLAATAYLQTGAVVGVLTWGFVADLVAPRVRAGRFYVVALEFLCAAPLGVWILHTNTLAGLKLATASFGFFSGGLSANVVAAAYDVVEMKHYGIASGLINLANGTGGGASVLLVGWIRNPDGPAIIVKWIALALVASAVMLIAVAAARQALEHQHAQLAIHR